MTSTDNSSSVPVRTSVEVWLDSDDAASGSARALVHRVGDDMAGTMSEDAELVASELVANAAEHGAGDRLWLRVRRIGATAIEVCVFNRLTSPARGVPDRPWRMPGMDAIRGRGLAVVENLSSRVAVVRTNSGVEVSVTLAD